MGYNPFDVFRRHQKKLFGVLTVFVMLMFVLSFGQGDFFSWFPKLIGAGSDGGEPVATVNGKNVTNSELNRLQTRRALASEFMLASCEEASRKVAAYLREQVGTASKENQPLLKSFLQGATNQQNPYLFFTPGFMDRNDIEAYFNPQSQAQVIARTMGNARRVLGFLAADAKATKEDKDLARNGITLIEMDERRFFSKQIGYFLHREEGEDTLGTALNYDLWIRKADALGIKYTTQDAMAIYNTEFNSMLDPVTLGKMEQERFATKPNYSREMLWQALAEEFKVRVAKDAVLGNERRGELQMFNAPFDVYEFYRRQCDPGTFSVVSIPAEIYVKRVQGEPDANTVRELFTKYKNVEPDPTRDGVGLKEPRRLKLGWLEVKGNEDFYKKAGESLLPAAEMQAKASLFALAPVPGAEFALIAAPVVANLKDAVLQNEYDSSKYSQGLALEDAWFPSFRFDGLHKTIDRSVLAPANIASVAAVAAGSLMTGASPITAPLVLIERSRMEDRNARARVLAKFLMAPTDFGNNLLGSAVAAGAMLPAPLPLDVVRNDLLAKVKEKITTTAATADIAGFEKEMAKLGKEKDKTAVKAYLAKFVADRGLKTGESAAFRDIFGMDTDPGLTPLVDHQRKQPFADEHPLAFSYRFFMMEDPLTGKRVPTNTYYEPGVFPKSQFGGDSVQFRDGQPQFLAWRTEETVAEAAKDLEKNKPRIVELWKRLEARKLAAADAEAFAKDLRETLAKDSGGDQTSVIQRHISNQHAAYQQQFLIDDRLKSFHDIIEGVAPIVMRQDPQARMMGQGPQPAPFQLKPTRKMPYPSAKMQQELLAAKDKKLGTVVVMNDDSKDNYYVAALNRREDRPASAFHLDVYSGLSQLSGTVNYLSQQEARAAAMRNAVALLKAEFKVKEDAEKMAKK